MLSTKTPVWRWLLRFGVMIGILIVILPMLMSSKWVYGPLVERLKAENFHLSVGAVRLSWLAPIRMQQLSIEQEHRPGAKLLIIREVVADRGLLGFLFSGSQLGRWEVFEPVIDVELLQKGSNVEDLARAISGRVKNQNPKDRKPSPAIDVDVRVKRASVVVHKSDSSEPLVVIPPWDFDLSVRAANGKPSLHLQPTRWLDHVKLTPELMKMGLEFALPAMARSAWLDGDVTLDSDRVDISLDHMADSSGQCLITFHSVRAGFQSPAMIGVTKALAKFAGHDSDGEIFLVDGTQLQVHLENGFVHHEGMRFGLPRLDPRLQLASSGQVGIVNRSLDVALDFPVPLEWLARSDDVRALGVPTVRLPVTGSLDDPKVNWMAMREQSADLLSTIQSKLGDDSPAKSAAVGMLEGLANGAGDDAIRATADLFSQLRKLRKQRPAEPEPAESEPAESERKTDAAPEPVMRGPLRDLLRRRLEQR